MDIYVFKEKGQAFKVHNVLRNRLRVENNYDPSNLKVKDSVVEVASDLSGRVKKLIKRYNYPLRKAK